jgi:hypothetical protein
MKPRMRQIIFALLLFCAYGYAQRCPLLLASLDEAGFGHLNYGEKSGLHRSQLWEILGEGTPEEQYRRARDHVKAIPRPEDSHLWESHAKKMANLLHDCFKEIEFETEHLPPKDQWTISYFVTADKSHGFLGKLGPILIVRSSNALMYKGQNRSEDYQPFSQWTPDYDYDLKLIP